MIHNAWDKFWFSEASAKPLGLIRIGLGILTAVYLASWFSDIAYWFSSKGVVATPRIAELLQTAAEEQPVWTRISPLFWIESETGLYAYLALGIIVALLAAVGLGGRIATLATWFMVVALVHRGPMLSGLCEPLLSLGWAYLTIHPGKVRSPLTPGLADLETSVAANIATRLLQIHLFAWLMLIVASQSAGLAWWQGDAVWWLISQARSPLLSANWLGGHPYFVNALTHGLVLCEMLCLMLLWPEGSRRFGIVMVWVVGLLTILCSDQLIYPLALSILALAFYPTPWQSKP